MPDVSIAVDRYGLLVEGDKGLRLNLKRPSPAEVRGGRLADSNQRKSDSLTWFEMSKPTVLIGVSGQPGAFTKRLSVPWRKIPNARSSFRSPTRLRVVKQLRSSSLIGPMGGP